MALTEDQIQGIVNRLQVGESVRSIATATGVAKQRISEIRKQAGLAPGTFTTTARDAGPVNASPKDKASLNDAGKLRIALSRLLPVKERAALMVDLIKNKDVPAATRARMLERVDALCGIHEAPPERETNKPLFEIEGLPKDLSFSPVAPEPSASEGGS